MILAVVETIHRTNCRSVPDMLRDSADSIETETDDDDRTASMIAVQVTESGDITVYGWGSTNDLHALGALAAGIHHLNQVRET